MQTSSRRIIADGDGLVNRKLMNTETGMTSHTLRSMDGGTRSQHAAPDGACQVIVNTESIDMAFLRNSAILRLYYQILQKQVKRRGRAIQPSESESGGVNAGRVVRRTYQVSNDQSAC